MTTGLKRFAHKTGRSIFKRLPGPVQGWWTFRSRQRGPPLNGQSARAKLLCDLIDRCGVEQIVETGTHYGETTAWLAEFGRPVVSAEIVPQFAWSAKFLLRRQPNVRIYNLDSIKMLKRLAAKRDSNRLRTLFYLDAHWYRVLPLRDEIAFITARFRDPIIFIDDFEVPGDPGYGFDDYGPDKRLTLDYIRPVLAPGTILYAPSTPSSEETGAKRGSAVAASSSEITGLLDTLPLLRRWSGYPERI